MFTDMYDFWGWYSQDPKNLSRRAGVTPENIPVEAVEGEPYPNWSGSEWLMVPYLPPTELPEVLPTDTEPEWAWYIDKGPFADRFGAKSYLVDTSNDSFVQSFNTDLARRQWVDLKNLKVAVALGYLAGQTVPGIGTIASPILTQTEVDAILNTPVSLRENLALRKVFFKGASE